MLALWSLNYIAGKVALRTIDPVSLAAFRIEIAAIAMLFVYFAQPSRSRLRMRDVWTFTYLGFFGVIVNQCLFTIGLNYTTSNHSSLIIAVGPIIILLLASAMKLESLTLPKLLGMAISFVGILFLEAEQGSPVHSPFLRGDLLTLAGTIGFSIFAVLGKRVSAKYDAVSMNTFNCVSAAILLLPLSIHQASHIAWNQIGWQGWAGLVYMALGSSVAAYTIFYYVLRHMTASRVGAISYFQPIAVILLSIVFFHENPSRNLLLSTALVLLGVYMAERGRT